MAQNKQATEYRLSEKQLKEINKTAEYMERNFGPLIPVDYVMAAVYDAYGWGGLHKNATERSWQVTNLIQQSTQAYWKLKERCHERARIAFALESVTIGNFSQIVDRAVFEAVKERFDVFLTAPIWLDKFSDVIWPAVQRFISQALGIDCQIDESQYESWLEEIS